MSLLGKKSQNFSAISIIQTGIKKRKLQKNSKSKHKFWYFKQKKTTYFIKFFGPIEQN